MQLQGEQESISLLQSELHATKGLLLAAQTYLSQTQDDLERTTRDFESQLASSREQIAQLTETKVEHEQMIAQLEGKFDDAKQLIAQRGEFMFEQDRNLFHASRTPHPAMTLERKQHSHANRPCHQ